MLQVIGLLKDAILTKKWKNLMNPILVITKLIS